jgi:ssDNA-binding Zn-finger/Zn-ribbon topoisomerase 1
MTKKETCPKCGSPLVVKSYTIEFNHRFKIVECSNPHCDYETFLSGVE